MLVQSRHPFPRIRHFGEAGIGVLPEVEEFLVVLDGSVF